MTDSIIQDAEEIEFVVDDDDGARMEVEEFSIGYDAGDSDVEPTAMAVGKTEYEFSIAFEPSLEFLLWLYGLQVDEGAVS